MAVNDAQTSMQTSTFAKLPREMLDGIASFLPTRDFNNLRLSCKQVENILFPYWANCFFTFRQFMISDFSLNALLDISCHPVLSKYLTHLAIGLDYLTVDNIRSSALTEVDDLASMISERNSQERLLCTGEAVHILSQALANLPNLDYIDIRDYSSPTRYRDVACWRSYGSSLYQNPPHLNQGPHPARMEFMRFSDAFVGRVFKVIITALGKASSSRQSPVRRLDLINKCPNGALPDDAFALGRAPEPALCTMLSGLTVLHLTLSLRTRTHSLDASTHEPLPYNISMFNLQRFLTLTPNLVWLRLNNLSRRIQFDTDKPLMDAFFSWLALRPGETPKETNNLWREMPMASVSLPLKKLDLGQWTIPSQVLASLLRKYSGLEHLGLFKFTLLRKPDYAAASDSSQDPRWPKVYRALFRALPGIIPRLKHIHLVDLWELDAETKKIWPVVFVNENHRQGGLVVDKDVVDKDDLEKIAASAMPARMPGSTAKSESHNMDQDGGSSDDGNPHSVVSSEDETDESEDGAY